MTRRKQVKWIRRDLRNHILATLRFVTKSMKSDSTTQALGLRTARLLIDNNRCIFGSTGLGMSGRELVSGERVLLSVNFDARATWKQVKDSATEGISSD